MIETSDRQGQFILLGYAALPSMPFVLVVVKPRDRAWQAWSTLKIDLLIILLISIVGIFAVAYRLTYIAATRIEQSETKQRQTLHEMEHTNKLASIGRLAAGVAHEINNPLAIIDQKTGLMQDLLKNATGFPLSARFEELTGSIAKAVDRCRTITHRLLGFARRMEVDITVIDLNQVVREVLGFLEQEACNRNIDLRLELAVDLPKIASDQNQLQQVFLNIINNAFEAVPDGGRVTVVSWEPDLETVAVSISDNGPGMSEETKSHIFEPFFSTKKGYGTGLGLSITYGIVKKLGGDIRVNSHLEAGATFVVTLPKKASPTIDTTKGFENGEPRGSFPNQG